MFALEQKMITIRMNACNLFQVTNKTFVTWNRLHACILFNKCVLALFLHISNTVSHNHFSP